MLFRDKKEEALGGNFKIKDIKVFSSKENLYLNVKKYRKVFDESECRYIYCELSFYNKLFDEIDWKAHFTFTCIDLKTEKEICKLEKKLDIEKDKNIIYVREGWGTPDPGWWKKGAFKWEVRIDEELVGTSMFYIIDGGMVSETFNPYFDIIEVRLFESTKEGLPIPERRYLQKFDSDITRFINLEMKLINKMKEEKAFPLEIQFHFYNDAGQKKAHMHYFKMITDSPDMITLDTGYGSDTPGYWFKDRYTIEAVFMDQLIAVVPLEVAEMEVEQDGPLVFATINEREAGAATAAIPKPSFEEAKAELEALIGLNSVKSQINELASYLQFLKVRREKGLEADQPINLHSVFTGNPGTGKTTVAKMLGKIYHSLDLLSHGNVLEVGRADLVGEFIGQTAPKVKKALEKAKGGILFIDEAYALTNRGDENKDFGKEVIEVLLKELAEESSDIAIIFAGYPKEMQNFLNSNPGLASRLRNIIQFQDYSPDELMHIAEYAANKRGVNISDKGAIRIHKHLVEVYRNRNEHFGNARYVNGIIEEAKQNMALRLVAESGNIELLDSKQLSTIKLKDVKKVFRDGVEDHIILPVDQALLDDALHQLHSLIGLEDIKREVDELAKLVQYYREIGKNIKKAFSLHTVFIGNPGTGKTTVARLLVQIYKALGILERGHLVECDRSSLVAGHVGQTAIKSGEVIDQAIGGGLFIDEAYALTKGGANDFGGEVIETLLKRMEDHRGEFMVIVAGYPKEMGVFLEANPGLMSRFDKQFAFKDYHLEELLGIAKMMFDKEELQLNKAATEKLSAHISKLLENKHKYFGNARTIRKIVNEAIKRQNLRMANMDASERSPEMISTVHAEDFTGFQLLEEENEKKGIGFR